MQVTVKMRDQVARQWGETPDAVGRHVMEDAAIEGYRGGRLSHRQVGEMLVCLNKRPREDFWICRKRWSDYERQTQGLIRD